MRRSSKKKERVTFRTATDEGIRGAERTALRGSGLFPNQNHPQKRIGLELWTGGRNVIQGKEEGKRLSRVRDWRRRLELGKNASKPLPRKGPQKEKRVLSSVPLPRRATEKKGSPSTDVYTGLNNRGGGHFSPRVEKKNLKGPYLSELPISSKKPMPA